MVILGDGDTKAEDAALAGFNSAQGQGNTTNHSAEIVEDGMSKDDIFSRVGACVGDVKFKGDGVTWIHRINNVVLSLKSEDGITIIYG